MVHVDQLLLPPFLAFETLLVSVVVGNRLCCVTLPSPEEVHSADACVLRRPPAYRHVDVHPPGAERALCDGVFVQSGQGVPIQALVQLWQSLACRLERGGRRCACGCVCASVRSLRALGTVAVPSCSIPIVLIGFFGLLTSRCCLTNAAAAVCAQQIASEAFLAACKLADLPYIQWVYGLGSVDVNYQQTPLAMTMDSAAPVDDSHPSYKLGPLMQACKHGNLEVVKWLLTLEGVQVRAAGGGAELGFVPVCGVTVCVNSFLAEWLNCSRFASP